MKKYLIKKEDKKHQVEIWRIIYLITYRWFTSPNRTPNVMWVTPKI